jgi:tRNA(adenine34) deaminase
VYCTVEPCFMCAGALVHARVARVVWAVPDPKFGGCESLGRVLDVPGANHRCTGEAGPGADTSRELLRSFFRTKRTQRDPRSPG